MSGYVLPRGCPRFMGGGQTTHPVALVAPVAIGKLLPGSRTPVMMLRDATMRRIGGQALAQ
jgi:hypothetical protein